MIALVSARRIAARSADLIRQMHLPARLERELRSRGNSSREREAPSGSRSPSHGPRRGKRAALRSSRSTNEETSRGAFAITRPWKTSARVRSMTPGAPVLARTSVLETKRWRRAMNRRDRSAPMSLREVARAIESGLVASILCDPDRPGLSEREIQQLGSRIGLLPGEIRDVLDRLPPPEADRFLPPQHVVEIELLWWTTTDDLRSVKAFDILAGELNTAGRTLGAKAMVVSMDVLLERARSASVTELDLRVAIRVHALAGKVVVEPGGVRALEPSWFDTLPSVMLRKNLSTSSAEAREKWSQGFREVLALTREVIAARALAPTIPSPIVKESIVEVVESPRVTLPIVLPPPEQKTDGHPRIVPGTTLREAGHGGLVGIPAGRRHSTESIRPAVEHVERWAAARAQHFHDASLEYRRQRDHGWYERSDEVRQSFVDLCGYVEDFLSDLRVPEKYPSPSAVQKVFVDIRKALKKKRDLIGSVHASFGDDYVPEQLGALAALVEELDECLRHAIDMSQESGDQQQSHTSTFGDAGDELRMLRKDWSDALARLESLARTSQHAVAPNEIVTLCDILDSRAREIVHRRAPYLMSKMDAPNVSLPAYDTIRVLTGDVMIRTLLSDMREKHRLILTIPAQVFPSDRAGIVEKEDSGASRPRRNLKYALILTALRVEYEAVRDMIGQVEEEEDNQGTVYEIGNVDEWNVMIAEVGAGNVDAAARAERAIQHLSGSVEVAMFVGVAGGIKDVNIGDVVVATKVYAFERGKDTAEGFRPRPDMNHPSYRLVERARAEARKSTWLGETGSGPKPRVLLAPIAAGEKVVADTRSATAAFLKVQYGDAAAVEMEGYGFLQAARAHSDLNVLVVRGISDLLSNKEQSDSEGSQERASINAAKFAIHLLRTFALSRASKQPNAPRNEHHLPIHERVYDVLCREADGRRTVNSTLRYVFDLAGEIEYESDVHEALMRLKDMGRIRLYIEGSAGLDGGSFEATILD